jgi:hypothetical protein
VRPAEIFFPVITDLIDPASDQKGKERAKSHYPFKERQKELAKEKKEGRRRRNLERKAVETDETEEDLPLEGRTP